eukprot:153028_1
MLSGPRKSITALFGLEDNDNSNNNKIRGLEISHPTKSFATNSWAQDPKANKAQAGGHGLSDVGVAELKHAHMSLLAERARVKELEVQLKALMEDKYTNQSSIIDQLRSSQDKLRE